MTAGIRRLLRAILAFAALPVALAACASGPKRAAPAASPAPERSYGQAADVSPAQAPKAFAEDSVAPASPPPAAGSYATPPGRAATMRQASAELESSQRELDVAAGDCRNACRALGSMDRATGRLCALVQSDDEQRRCGDAKARVYSARDKVKTMCGVCPDASVERADPIPSR